MIIRVARIYDTPSADDGYRVLVDRLWPRGVSKQRAALDEWAKDLAPSTALRLQFHHDPARFAAFRQAYIKELDANPAVKVFLAADHPTITLLTATKDTHINHAVVLRDYLLHLSS